MAEELKHYGVKGMKWGVRKARTGDLNLRASRLERVADGTATKMEKFATAMNSTAANLVRSGGLKKEAARRAKNLRGQEERLATGKAKTSDILKAYGTISISSLALAAHKKSDHKLGS
ncbi:hypothetical protein SEA_FRODOSWAGGINS_9 [Streptomyces phage FrodoSwaggins]|uniref:Uncharacterized protein n=7 Tax=Rimavirus TaxID=2560214 RepID=A0A649VX99_9CAUD|nr:hypothetical protein FDH06_gp10 [Streptomyces phage Rima]YP_009612539.1 hypothetical protein FDI43_gp09 [Streptomyces phage DrGrey]AOZ64875.1 hypothetical protein SEA_OLYMPICHELADO_10 [Streptomyces phage OlympicHelado]QAY16308.1 hypothetical protein SEA_NAMO_10 [Streptomyces phage Namo]QAY17043.1 hypothetical protein SEA_POPY_9 [Streptomyces phage Popy]QGJ96549.1 hypothetical protein SEA_FRODOSWAGGINS_9 [Streptomyces phage FrodoSwaggins]QNN99485.1 hypothetical protein SEA_TIEDYE_9 [Strepto